ncbi:MAG: hypothetical protein R3E53_07435 [Myxococcota bacterium]
MPAGRPADLDEVVWRSGRRCSLPADSELVAWRGRDRFVRRFEPRPLPARRDGGHSPLVEGGTYLITGGLGGLGLTLADRLLA